MSRLAEAAELWRARRGELCGLWAMAFIVSSSYAVARPASESLFLQAHSSESLPWVWLAVGATAGLVVTLYNRLAARLAVDRVLGRVILTSAATLALALGLVHAGVPGAAFVLYVWKDLYMVVLVETFWSFANCVFPIKSARWLYGTFLMAGSLGGISGNLVVGELAGALGTRDSLWLLMPVFALAYGGSRLLATAHRVAPPRAAAPPAIFEGLRVVQRSRFLGLLLMLIVVVQLAVNLIDYQFNVAVEAAFSDTDARTRAIGEVYAAIEAAALVLQMSAGFVLRFVGVSATLLVIPAALGLAVTSFLVAPGFATAAVCKVTSKCFDYSLFRAAKEILYIPLSYAEKTQGKAIIDVFTYRVAKALASLLLLGLTALAALTLSSALTLGLVGVWVGLALLITRRHRRMVAQEHEAFCAATECSRVGA